MKLLTEFKKNILLLVPRLLKHVPHSVLSSVPGHPQAWKVGGDNENVQPGERVCSQDRVCSWEARRDQPQQGLLAGTLKAHWGKHSIRNDVLGSSRCTLEPARVFHMTAGVVIPAKEDSGSNRLIREGGSFQLLACLLLDSSENYRSNIYWCAWSDWVTSI